MKIPFEKLIGQAGEGLDTLTGAERERIRTLLADYAAFKPVRSGTVKPTGRGIHVFMRPVFAGSLIALIAVGTGGATYAAEGTLPGDLLYPVKVGITEPVVTAFTPNGRAQVTWQLTIAKRRLKEAATLSGEGRLATSTEATLTEQAAGAALKGAVDAAALNATTTASTTETLIQASGLLLEGRGRLKQHDEKGASRAFRASIHAAVQLKILTQTTGSLDVEGFEDATSSPEDSEGQVQATSSDNGAAAIESVLRMNDSAKKNHDARSTDQ
jgi:hypothetical protein